MQNREVPVGNLPIFFSSLRLAEAGRTCPEVRGGRQDAEHGQPSAGRRRRSHGHGRGVRGAGDGGTGTGAGCGAAGAGRGARVRNTEDAGVGRGTQNAERGTRKTWTRARARGAGDGRRGTGDGAQAPVHGTQRDRIRPARPRNNRPGPFTAGRHPPPGPIRRDLSRLDARRRDPQQPAGAIHSRAPSATGTCNNPPGPFTAGRHPPRAAPYLSRVRIRITPLPPRTPYMLLPRCTSTDLTS